MNKVQQIPADMMVNGKGHFVPKSTIEDVDIERNDVVISLFERAENLQRKIIEDKVAIQNNIAAFLELSAEQYGVSQGGKKGNVTLKSFDGLYKIQIAMQDHIEFDERLQTAKQLIDECVMDWSSNSNDNVKALITHAFQVDKAGKINTGRVLGLLSLKIKETKWQTAMQAIRDSIQVTDTKEYIRFSKRNESGGYDRLTLDFAGL